MEDQQESIMKEMEETRSSMTEKLEALETHVADKVKPVADAVERVADAAATIVENVKETVHGVTEKVEETAAAFTSAFDLGKQTENHPWLMFGIAATTGCVLGSLLGSRSRQSEKASQESAPKHAKEGNGKSHHTRAAAPKRSRERDEPRQESWITDSLRHLKELALGSLMSAVRDLAKQGIPGAIGEKLADEIEGITRKMGAEPIKGPVLAENSPPKQGTPEDPEFKTLPEPVNRILASG